MTPLKILAIEPYYSGSHRAFIDGWIRNSVHQWRLFTLPGHHWKWRMRHSAIHMSELLGVIPAEEFDLIFVTDMLDVAAFRGFLSADYGRLPIVLYFHENQFEYPSKNDRPRDHHFGFTNFTSSIAADNVWFNSAFNRDSFLGYLKRMLKRLPDFPPLNAIDRIETKSRIENPGIELSPQIKPAFSKSSEPIHLIWAARWEHDKQPQLLLDGLRKLKQKQVPFRVSVIGEQFARVPEPFTKIETEFADQLVKFGYQESRDDYFAALCEADVFFSTAAHEFFGLSAAEAISSGLHPLLPAALAYPELLSAEDPANSLHFYDGTADELANRIGLLAGDRNLLSSKYAQEFRSRFEMKIRSAQMDQSLVNIAQPGNTDHAGL